MAGHSLCKASMKRASAWEARLGTCTQGSTRKRQLLATWDKKCFLCSGVPAYEAVAGLQLEGRGPPAGQNQGPVAAEGDLL